MPLLQRPDGAAGEWYALVIQDTIETAVVARRNTSDQAHRKQAETFRTCRQLRLTGLKI